MAKNYSADPSVMEQMRFILNEVGLKDEVAVNKLLDLVSHQSPLRANSSFKQQVELCSIVSQAFGIGYFFKENGGEFESKK